MTTCPNCGKEVADDFGYCPYCATPLKLFCPSCKRELKAGYNVCPYCGFSLESATPAKQLYLRSGKSLYLRILTILCLVSGIIDVIQGANESTFQFANFQYQGPIADLARYLALFEVPVGALLVVVGVVQLLVVYGLVFGRTFPRRYLLRVVTLVFVLAVVILAVDATMSIVFPLPSVSISFDIFFVLWSFLTLAATYRYVSQQEARDILRATGAPQPS